MYKRMIVFCILITIFRNVDAKILSGHLFTYENWVFLTRFCFLSEQGVFGYDFWIEGTNSSMNLLLYYDSSSQWPSVYPSNKSCRQKEAILNPDYGQIIPLNAWSADCIKTNSTVHCNSQRRFRSVRPRWWFMVLSDCRSKNGLNVTYKISLRNSPVGSFWREHFSADEFYILPELIIIACSYFVLAFMSINIACKLRARRLLHVSYKIFIASLLLQLIGILCEMYNYIQLGLYGSWKGNLSLLGNLLEVCSENLYTLLMLLLSFGYTVTKSVLTMTQIRWFVCLMSISVVCQLMLFVYQSEVFDPGLVLYIFESPPGYGLIALKLVAWIVFVIRCFRTTKKMNTKFNFYASLSSLGSAWFLCHPLTVLSITLLVDKWVRESVVKGCSLLIIFLGHATFLYITRPSIANSRFPFHIRTCQIVPIGGEGQNHSYEPQTQTAMSAFTISHIQPFPNHVT